MWSRYFQAQITFSGASTGTLFSFKSLSVVCGPSGSAGVGVSGAPEMEALLASRSDMEAKDDDKNPNLLSPSSTDLPPFSSTVTTRGGSVEVLAKPTASAWSSC